jgi:hypothetical protein
MRILSDLIKEDGGRVTFKNNYKTSQINPYQKAIFGSNCK